MKLGLGENGAGKTTLLDLMMGFKKPTQGRIRVFGEEFKDDSCDIRKKVAYLSEKVDIPGDWNGRDFLDFHSFFYENYDYKLEKELLETFQIDQLQRTGNLSTGQIRRLQIVGALASKPKLIIIDEITAVLDIVARIRLLQTLLELQEKNKLSVILATNIPEGLEHYATHVLLLNQGKQMHYGKVDGFLKNYDNLAEQIMEELS